MRVVLAVWDWEKNKWGGQKVSEQCLLSTVCILRLGKEPEDRVSVVSSTQKVLSDSNFLDSTETPRWTKRRNVVN